MTSLSAGAILRAWEGGVSRGGLERGLALLSVARPEVPAGRLRRWPLGWRDHALLGLRQETFGPGLDAALHCPACRVELVFRLDLPDLIGRHPASPEPGGRLDHAGYTVHYRLPSGDDLAALAAAPDVAAARILLLERCVDGAWYGEEAVPAGELPPEVIAALATAWEEGDPLAEIPLEIECGGCGRQVRALLDIGAFLWSEVAAAAERLLYEVHTLAAAYGWSEREILALSAARRRHYIGLLLSR